MSCNFRTDGINHMVDCIDIIKDNKSGVIII